MAFGHKPIHIGADQPAALITAYLANPQSTTSSYYAENNKAFMRWVANEHVRAQLGLADQVNLRQVEALLAGRHPVTGQQIRRPGWRRKAQGEPAEPVMTVHDVTLSPAPKSLSVLWALAPLRWQREIELIVGQAANSAIGRMFDRVPLVREWVPELNDSRHALAEDYVAIQAFHTTARLTRSKPGVPDPNLHLHTLIVGALDTAGQIKAVDGLPILQYRSELDAEASARLAEELRVRGFPIERRIEYRNGQPYRVCWEIAGVPQSLVEAMSARSREVEELKVIYREQMQREPEGPDWDQWFAEQRGAKSTRPPAEIKAAWEAEGDEHGFGPAEALALLNGVDSAVQARPQYRDLASPEAEQFRQEILAELNREHALVPVRKLAALAQQRAIGLLEPNVARRLVGRMFGARDLLESDRGEVTTLEVLAAEQRAMRAAQALLEAAPESAVSDTALEADAERRRAEGQPPLDPEQQRVVRLATSGRRFTSITGWAGTGKGFTSAAIVAAFAGQLERSFQHQGRRVIALALAGRTTMQFQADSQADEARTLDGLHQQLLHGSLQLTAKDVLLLDEAGMVDHHRYADFLEAAAEANASLVQIGDHKQLSPVGPGGLWRRTHELAEKHGQAAELTWVYRIRDPQERAATKEIRQGDLVKGLTWYRNQGRLQLYENRAELLHGMAARWRDTADPDALMVLDTSNSERDSLNRIIQRMRWEAGEVSDQGLLLASQREIRIGDRVLFNAIHQLERKEGQPRPRRVENGTPGTVVDLVSRERAPGLGVRDTASEITGAVVELEEPKREARQIIVDATAPLELAYGRHIVKGQGASANVGGIGTGLYTSREQLYTMLTRYKNGVTIHALREHVELLGLEPEQLDRLELQAGDQEPAADQAQRQQKAEEQAALETIAERAERSSEKQAIGEGATWKEGPQQETGWTETAEIDSEKAGDRKPVYQVDQAQLWRQERAQQQLQQRLLERESDMASLHLFNEAEIRPGQVVQYAEAVNAEHPIAKGELGVVWSLHRGGFTYDYAKVELVGGRQVMLAQTDPAQLAPPEVKAVDVLQQQPTLVQRDPMSLSALPLTNGQILQAEDRVQLQEAYHQAEAGEWGTVVDVDRHGRNRATMRMEREGRLVDVYSGAPLRIQEPEPEAQEPPAPEIQESTAQPDDVQPAPAAEKPAARVPAHAGRLANREAANQQLVAQAAEAARAPESSPQQSPQQQVVEP
ncbi:MobF family relaxase [Candidatus Nephthysia bennettiae]|uniref:Relaxase domain-containing protein n=1 Tax=Candidatus Nephthysia bennettiae TaxID=3127016 RepID=A0A934K5K5_9BACT|nr:relaxase domain-containing protein [Candidatus Dormibacteraeota bacterium]